RRFRWWLLALIPMLAAGAIGFIWTAEGTEPAFRIPMTLMVLVAALLLFALWFTFLSGLRWRVRQLGLTGPALLVVLALLTLRAEGCRGDMMPQLAWKWTPVPDRTLSVPVVSEPVDLRTTSAQDFPRFLGLEGRATAQGVHLDRDWTKQPPQPRWRQPI